MSFKNKKRLWMANIVIFVGILFIPNFLIGQEATKHLQWESPSIDSIHFEGAYRDLKDQDLPWFVEGIPIQNGSDDVEVIPVETDTFPLDILSKDQQDFLSFQFRIETKVGFRKKEPVKTVKLLPLKLTRHNEVVAIRSFKIREIKGSSVNNFSKKQDSNQWKKRSVLANHDWYKIPISRTGVHKISHSYLQDLGLNANEIDPQNIHIYGNGGNMLPFSNKPQIPDDLKENAIKVVSRGNRFSSGDYILFYALGTDAWHYQENRERYSHQKHDFADKGYYYLSVHQKEGNKRIESQPSGNSPTYSTNRYDELHFHETEQITEINRNIKTGRDWYGEKFDRETRKSFDFKLKNRADSLFFEVSVAHRGSNGRNFKASVNGQDRLNIGLSGVRIHDYEAKYISTNKASAKFPVPNTDQFDVTLEYNKLGTSLGWLDYIELQARSELAFNNEQFTFRDRHSLEHSKVRYEIKNQGKNLTIWDVSNPYNVHQQSLQTGNGNTYFVDMGNDTLHQYVAFNADAAYEPEDGKKVANQNLHGLSQADMLIITHPSMRQQAERLADHHRNRDQMKVVVEEPWRIYNEFSSGIQDVTAIRNFVKMFYDKAENDEDLPEHLLLFGDASYDYKNRFDNNTNFVPTYQSANSYSPQNSYATDDYYGYLDENEGDLPNAGPSSNFLLDINIGRIPATNADEAKAVVDKIYRYHDNENAFGTWQNMVTFMADDMNDAWEDRHLGDSEKLASILNNNYPAFNIDKIYMDAFPQVTKSSGTRYPEATQAMNRRIEKGSLVMNYIGHGGERGLAHEKLLIEEDIKSWKNSNKLPLFITATCEFTRFDDPEFQSAGEKTLVKPDGGTIALLSTTRIVYASQNFNLNKSLFKNNLFEEVDGEHKTLGEIMTTAKNRIDQNSFVNNNRKFALFGDPALKLAYPREEVVTTHINEAPYSQGDSLKALQKVTIEGEIRNHGGSRIEGFDGVLYPTIFDKKVDQVTLANDENARPIPFKLRSSIIYKGKASVNDGRFKFEFVVPKDISYTEGEGKISYYATNKETDAHGYSLVQVGGTAEDPVQDNTPPQVKLYMNHTDFESGDVTSENPQMLGIVQDDYGINTAANGIGHQPTMTLDGKRPVILEDAYEADMDDSKGGTITNQLFELEEGRHTLKLKVWDIANNSGESTIEFVVANSTQMAIENLLNYPNPFSSETQFQFNHNQSGNLLKIKIRIFDLNGNHVRTLQKSIVPEGNQVSRLKWKGNNQYGAPLESGMYVYQLRLQNANGEVVTETDKLVIQK